MSSGRYSKVQRKIWNDAKFRRLTPPPPNGQTLFLRLLTAPELGVIPGLIPAGEAALAEALEWPLEGFREAFREVFREGLAKADWKARLVFLPKALKHNPPESPNVVKSWGNTWTELPECPLKDEALKHLRAFIEGMGEGFQKAFIEAFGKPSPNQEQEQEQETDMSPSAPSVVEVPNGNATNDVGQVAIPGVDDPPAQDAPRRPTDTDRVYDHWRDATKRHNPRSRPAMGIDEEGRRLVRAAFKAGRTVDDLQLAVEGLFLSPHHLGFNDRQTQYLAFKHAMKPGNIDGFVAAAVAEREKQAEVFRLPNRDDWIPETEEEARNLMLYGRKKVADG